MPHADDLGNIMQRFRRGEITAGAARANIFGADLSDREQQHALEAIGGTDTDPEATVGGREPTAGRGGGTTDRDELSPTPTDAGVTSDPDAAGMVVRVVVGLLIVLAGLTLLGDGQ